MVCSVVIFYSVFNGLALFIIKRKRLNQHYPWYLLHSSIYHYVFISPFVTLCYICLFDIVLCLCYKHGWQMGGGAMSIVFSFCSSHYIGEKGMMVEWKNNSMLSMCYTIYWTWMKIIVDVLIGMVHIQIIERQTDNRKPSDNTRCQSSEFLLKVYARHLT